MGREVHTLTNKEHSAGYHTFIWNGDNSMGNAVSSGVYFIHALTPNNSQTIKAILLR